MIIIYKEYMNTRDKTTTEALVVSQRYNYILFSKLCFMNILKMLNSQILSSMVSTALTVP